MKVTGGYAPFAFNVFVTQSNITVKGYRASFVYSLIKVAFQPACLNSHSRIILAMHNAGKITFNDYGTGNVTILNQGFRRSYIRIFKGNCFAKIKYERTVCGNRHIRAEGLAVFRLHTPDSVVIAAI